MEMYYFENVSVDTHISMKETSYAVDKIYNEAVTDINLMSLDSLYMESTGSDSIFQKIANAIKKMLITISDGLTKFFTGKTRKTNEDMLKKALKENPELKNVKVEVPAHIVDGIDYEKYIKAVADGRDPKKIIDSYEKEKSKMRAKAAGKVGATVAVTIGALAALYLNKESLKKWARTKKYGQAYADKLAKQEALVAQKKNDVKFQQKHKKFNKMLKDIAAMQEEEKKAEKLFNAQKDQINAEFQAMSTFLKGLNIDIMQTDDAIFRACRRYFKPEQQVFSWDRKHADKLAQDMSDTIISLKRDKEMYDSKFDPNKRYTNSMTDRDSKLIDSERAINRKVRHGLAKLNPLTRKRAKADETMAKMNEVRK